MQQKPSYRKSLENWYPYFSQSMGGFLLSESHPVVYSIIWEMNGFSHETYPHKICFIKQNILLQKTRSFLNADMK